MSRRRLQRLNEQFKRELSELIRTGVRDPRVGLVTVTAVDITSDISLARVYVRVLGDAAEVEEGLAGLTAAAPFLRAALGRELTIRRIPELRFQRDQSMEHALRIERILADVLPDDEEQVEGVEVEVDGAPEAENGDAEERSAAETRGERETPEDA